MNHHPPTSPRCGLIHSPKCDIDADTPQPRWCGDSGKGDRDRRRHRATGPKGGRRGRSAGIGAVPASQRGRKSTESYDEELATAFDLVDRPGDQGRSDAPLRWTSKSIRGADRRVARRSAGQRIRRSAFVVRGRLQVASQHQTRGATSMSTETRSSNTWRHKRRDTWDPVISADTKKRKELVGTYKNAAQEWHLEGEPEQVKVDDFIDPAVEKANPHGVYDIANNVGWVSVGTDHDTAAFAVETIRRLLGTRQRTPAPFGDAPSDLRRRWRHQRLPHPVVENRTGEPGHRNRTGHHRRSPATRHLQMEQRSSTACSPPGQALPSPRQ